MKKTKGEFVVSLYFLFFIVLCLPFNASGSEQLIPNKRQLELKHILKNDCGSCHGLSLKGGLGLPLNPESLNSKSNEYLTYIILEGKKGTPMPPWKKFITPDEADWLVKYLKKGPEK